MGQTVIRPPYRWPEEKNTQHRNMLAALEAATGEYIVVIEDDDAYGPNHVANMVAALDSAELAGEIPSRYYHVRERAFLEFNNDKHASLCQTGFRRSMIPAVEEICSQGKWIDMTLWARYGSRGALYRSSEVVGIKGMPGRGGVSDHHRHVNGQWQGDAGGSRLRQWIGSDADAYAPYTVQPQAIESRESSKMDPAQQLETHIFAGQVRYHCPEPGCKFDHYSIPEVHRHWKGSHSEEATGGAPGPVLFDSDNKPITRKIHVPR